MTYVQPQPGTKSSDKREWIYLKDVLKYFSAFKVKEPMVFLVGGLPSHKKTQGDIDILINLPESESDSSIAKVLEFRLFRSLPARYWPRVHFLYNDGAGPFTSYVPLFYLSAEILSKERHEMSVGKVTPLKFFKQMKPKFGRVKKETFTIEGLLKKVPAAVYPVSVDKKFDGMRIQIHAAGAQVKIWTEDGGDVTARFPSIVKEARGKNFVLDCEVTGEIKGRHMGRSDVSGYAHAKGKPFDKPFTANCFDILFRNGKDIHDLPLKARMQELNKVSAGGKIRPISRKTASTPKELKSAVEWAMKLPASEGAMIKSLESVYELDGTTNFWWKFKKELDIDAKVVKVNKVKNTNAYNYLSVIGDDTPVGLTYNTSIKAVPGDIIKVLIGNLNKYVDKKKNKSWYNWVFPRVVEKRTDKTKPDSTATADSIVKESGGFIAEKPWPERYKEFLSIQELIKSVDGYNPKSPNDKQLLDDHRITHAWASSIKSGLKHKYSLEQVRKLHDKIVKEMLDRGFEHSSPISLNEVGGGLVGLASCRLSSPEICSQKLDFVYQHHWRGKSVHGDMRFLLPSGKALEGYTMAVQKEGMVDKPIDTMKKAEIVDKQDIFKIDYKKGMPDEQKILVFTKATQPKVWLGMEGVSKKAEPGVPPQPGATRFFPGVIHILDQGSYYKGADKAFFKEYFMEGSVFKGRYIARKLPRSGKWAEAGKEPFIWFFWKAKEQNPYVLSTRGIRKADFSLEDSWLPPQWEKRIPDNLRWWGKNLSREAAIDKLKSARKILLETKLLSEKRFSLQRHWWKGQKVIRDLPVEHWDIRFSEPMYFSLDKNPAAELTDLTAVKKESKSWKKWLNFSGEIPPGEEGNPNKKIPAHVDIMDSGSYTILERTDSALSVEFRGKKLKGFYVFKRTDPSSNLWTFEKGKLPQRNSQYPNLTEDQIELIAELSMKNMFRSEIAEKVECAKSTVYLWQNRLGLL